VDDIVRKAKSPINREEVRERVEKAVLKRAVKRIEKQRVLNKERGDREKLMGKVDSGLKVLDTYKGGKFYVFKCGEMAGYNLGVGVLDIDGGGREYMCSSCWCSPSDGWSAKIAKGLIAGRLGDDTSLRDVHCSSGSNIPGKVCRHCQNDEDINLLMYFYTYENGVQEYAGSLASEM
jgi:hypothetical protein